METILHITNGDGAGKSLKDSEIPGKVLVCRDLLYRYGRNPGWPDKNALQVRANYLSRLTAGTMDSNEIFNMLEMHYRELSRAAKYGNVVLWFDACLCDQSMLAHVLVCLNHVHVQRVELICIDSFPGVTPFNGLGQLRPSQMASLYPRRVPVSAEQIRYARTVDNAFASQKAHLVAELSHQTDAPLKFVPAAAARWLQERPDPKTGLGRLEYLALKAIADGNETPAEIFSSVAEADESPQFWGDTDLWRKINALAERDPPPVRITGPAEKLPQGMASMKLKDFRIKMLSTGRDLMITIARLPENLETSVSNNRDKFPRSKM